MNVVKIRFVTAIIVTALLFIVSLVFRPKLQPSTSITKPVQLNYVAQPVHTAEHKDPESLPFEFAGKEIGAISPYDIAEFASAHPSDYVSFANLWNALGMEPEEWRLYEHCKVRNFRVSLDDNPDLEVLQRLYDKLSGWQQFSV